MCNTLCIIQHAKTSLKVGISQIVGNLMRVPLYTFYNVPMTHIVKIMLPVIVKVLHLHIVKIMLPVIVKVLHPHIIKVLHPHIIKVVLPLNLCTLCRRIWKWRELKYPKQKSREK